jgi:hypothetical protein
MTSERLQKWAAVEVRWDGAPPLPPLLRVIGRELASLDPGYLYLPHFDRRAGEDLAPSDVTPDGVCFDWYKHRGRLAEVAPLVGRRWPCKVRWLLYGDPEDERSEEDVWAELEAVEWVRSASLGWTDAHGRLCDAPRRDQQWCGRKWHPEGGQPRMRDRASMFSPRGRSRRAPLA